MAQSLPHAGRPAGAARRCERSEQARNDALICSAALCAIYEQELKSLSVGAVCCCGSEDRPLAPLTRFPFWRLRWEKAKGRTRHPFLDEFSPLRVPTAQSAKRCVKGLPDAAGETGAREIRTRSKRKMHEFHVRNLATWAILTAA